MGLFKRKCLYKGNTLKITKNSRFQPDFQKNGPKMTNTGIKSQKWPKMAQKWPKI